VKEASGNRVLASDLRAAYGNALTRPGAREVHYEGAEGLSVEKVAQHMGQRSVQTVRSWYLDIRVPPMAVFPIKLDQEGTDRRFNLPRITISSPRYRASVGPA
jgi:hypothetical protein